MPPLHLLIKPASGSCNLRCRYCFYADEAANRETASYGMMSLETLENAVEKALDFASGSCTFAFQGGEPTLAGLPFYRALMEMTRVHNRKCLKLNYVLQTNGILIDREWAEFLRANSFLVGLSLDGPKGINDRWRVDASGSGTFAKVQRAAMLLRQHGVEFNLLSVVTAQTARNIDAIYGFYQRNMYRYQQYIPCLDPLGEPRGGQEYSLTPELYAQFLKRLFDLWYQDVIHGRFAYNRYFENLVGILRGYPPESCGMAGHCTAQNVVEADGGVYPCDFYALDRYRLGNLNTDSFADIEEARHASGFVELSRQTAPECVSCEWFALCRGGCRRDRDFGGETLGLNCFCASYRDFFAYAIGRLRSIAARI